ncbi:MAG: 2-C-methyl-D-erythritol 4-phosphate cytidylyltransferase [Chthonomonadales bacterium]|nr:2-C-methyl-D-erythritol 4-phosphate cytidylyltransferase [Chthonomonadales bacterium]
MRVGAIVPAAGSGTRFGSGQPKLLVTVAGRTALEWSVNALAEHPRIDVIVIVAGAQVWDAASTAWGSHPKVAAVVAGGPTRCDSVEAGLRALPPDVDVVLVHDAARPAVDADTIAAVLDGVARVGAAVPGVPVADTMKRTADDGLVNETVSREGLWAVQTPQGARREALEAAYAMRRENPSGRLPASDLTDEAGLLENAGIPVAVVPGDPDNIKLTTAADAARLATILEGRTRTPGSRSETSEPMRAPDGSVLPCVRTGIGYDVHRLVEGRPLWLGGVQIPHARGLEGHSDADVVMHAVCDALLGAVGESDIGVLFPNTDPRNRNRPSREFVAEAARRVREKGYEISNIDVALQAEMPRIGPHREAMLAALADAAGISTTRIGLKATTNEGLGYVGRHEGIGCYAVATVIRTMSRD